MVNNVVDCLFIFISAFFILKKRNDLFLYYYFLFIFIAPVWIIGNQRISYHLLVFPLFFILFFNELIKIIKKIYKNNGIFNFCSLCFLFIILFIISSFIQKTTPSIITIYSIVRFLSYILILKTYIQKREINFKKLLFTLLVFNTIATCLQFLIKDSVYFFAEFYMKSNVSSLYEMLEKGYISRAHGLFASSNDFSAFILMAYTYFLGSFLKNINKKNCLGLVMSFICGFLTLTKTIYLGVPLITISFILVNFKNKNVKKLIKYLIYFCPIIIIFVYILNENGYTILYYLKYILHPFQSLYTRFDSQTGSLSSTIQLILKNPLIGYGSNNLAFLGDSSIITMTYQSGIIFTIIYLLYFVLLGVYLLLKRYYRESFLIVSLFICMLATNSAFDYYIAIFIGSVLGIYKNYNIENNKNIHVVHLISSLNIGGAETLLSNLIKYDNNQNIRFSIICLYGEKECNLDLLSTIKENKVNIIFMNKRKGKLNCITLLYHILIAFINEKPDILHTHLYGSIFSILPAYIANIDIKVHTVHNLAKNEMNFTCRIMMFFAYHFFGYVPIAISKTVQESIANTYKMNISKVIYIPNGYDNYKFKCIEKNDERVNDDLKLLSVGRLSSQKNHKLLISAFAKAKKEYPNISLTIIGDGELKDSLISFAKEINVLEDIHFLGFRLNVEKYMQNSDIFVLSSNYEGFGIVIAEALATKLCVITTDSIGIRELIKNNETGLIVPLNDSNELAKAIVKACKKPELRKKLANMGHEFIKNFSITKMIEKYNDIYINSRINNYKGDY